MENKKIKVAINGFGRIGRLFFKLALENDNIEIVAINDLGELGNMAYLLRFDSAQKDITLDVETKGEGTHAQFLMVGHSEIPFYSIKNPEELPWGDLDVDVVAECTGVFTSFEKSNAHLKAGAKRVVISGPVKNDQDTEFEAGKIGKTVLMGLNNDEIKTCSITSNASCTTNAAGSPLDVVKNAFGVESALLNTIHAYTASQSIVDGPVKPGKDDYRKGRAAAGNIVPTSTGSAIATTKVISELEGKFDGIALRVPVIAGSIVDITFITEKEVSADEVNEAFIKAENDPRYAGLLKTTSEQLVSSDIIGDGHTAIVDLSFTRVAGKLVKILAWYDNETGYANSLVKQVEQMGQSINS